MKILKNFDAKKIAKVKIKIFLAIVFVASSALFCLSSAFRVFVLKHPGLVGVLIAVSGEVYFDWKEERGKHAPWKKFFMALLIVSLSYELYEASESDKQAADAILESKRAETNAAAANERAGIAYNNAAQANERASKFDADRILIAKQAEEIRETNLVLQTKLTELEIKMGKRHLTDEQKSKISYALFDVPRGTIYFRCMASGDEETIEYENELKEFFKSLGFDIEDKEGMLDEMPEFLGIGIGVESTNQYPVFAIPIQRSFNWAFESTNALPGFIDNSITNAVIIQVGKKPPY